jgi:hypothetical protein
VAKEKREISVEEGGVINGGYEKWRNRIGVNNRKKWRISEEKWLNKAGEFWRQKIGENRKAAWRLASAVAKA